MPLLATKTERDSYINDIASRMSYVDIRKKGRVDISGILAVVNHFRSYGIDFDLSNSAHKIPSILEEFSITDIYYKGYRIDIISTLQEGIVSIPKKHFEYDITPDFYFVIKLQNDLTTFKTIGYIKPEDVINSKSDGNYYYPKEFAPVQELIEIIQKQKPNKSITGSHKDCESMFLRFLDKELSFSYKKGFIKHIMSCPKCLEKFRYFDNFNNSAKTITDYSDMVEKYYRRAVGKASEQNFDLPFEAESKIKNAISSTKDFIKNMFSKTYKPQIEKKSFDIGVPQNEEECIDLIFNHEDEEHQFKINTVLKRKKFAVLLIIPFVIISLIVFGIMKTSSSNKEQELPQEEFVNDGFEQASLGGEDFSQIWDTNMQEPGEIAQINNQVNKISWEIPKKLSKDDSYIKFLQVIGKNIQINLQNDLLVVRDVPTNRSVKVDVTFKNYGSIVSLKTTKGSGSEQIDNIIEKNIFNAFSYVKPPKTDFKNIDLTLLIEL